MPVPKPEEYTGSVHELAKKSLGLKVAHYRLPNENGLLRLTCQVEKGSTNWRFQSGKSTSSVRRGQEATYGKLFRSVRIIHKFT